jgi:hypothetical protein
MSKKQLEKFCKTPTKVGFTKLSKKYQRQLVDVSFDVLYQKTGDQQKALEILRNIGELEVIHGYIVYNIDNKRKLNSLDEFIRMGITTIPIIPASELTKIQKDFDKTLFSFPEYNRSSDNPSLNSVGEKLLYVLGGFSAFGNPASFHNMFVRSMRIKCWSKAILLFQQLIDKYHNKKLRKNYKVEVLFDRMMYRISGQKAVAESWHRDVMPKNLILERDEVYGGWINFDDKDQYFSCIPGSHLGIIQKNIPTGFDTMIKRETKKAQEEYKGGEKDEKDYIKRVVKQRMKDISSKRHKFRIPPGHMIIFPQYIMHEVVASAVKYNMKRLFLGWRMTISDKSIRNNEEMMDKQSVTPLPGGMIPPMYSSNHGSFYLGIPNVTASKKKLDWMTELSEKYISISPSINMTKLSKNLKSQILKSKQKSIIAKQKSIIIAKQRSIIADMNELYLKQSNINIKFDRSSFIKDDKLKITLSTFKTIPTDPNSKTTLIKWSADTMKKETINLKQYKGEEGNYHIVERHMKSLKEYGFPMYPKYGKQEKIIYKPNKVNSC